MMTTASPAQRVRARNIAGFDIPLLKFLLRQRLVGFKVSERPQFGMPETAEWFTSKLRSSKKYLEFGTGGSTYLAASFGVPFIAVDSDPYFLESVKKKIRKDGYFRKSGQTYRYADIGMTGYWGFPLRSWNASDRRLEKFRRYSDPPPECFEGGTLPDLVLVDGRFRVACALKAIRMLQHESNWSIIVDDYRGRPQYEDIEDFSQLDTYVGQAAVFTAYKAASQQRLESAIRHYETVPD